MLTTKPRRPLVLGYRFFRPDNGSIPRITDYRDMLRYDHAFVCSYNTVPYVAFVTYRVKGQGVYQGVPTFDRWRSFGIKLDENVPNGDLHAHITRYPAAWKTYIHPRIDGRTDYGQLVEFTLFDFLAGKEE